MCVCVCLGVVCCVVCGGGVCLCVLGSRIVGSQMHSPPPVALPNKNILL